MLSLQLLRCKTHLFSLEEMDRVAATRGTGFVSIRKAIPFLGQPWSIAPSHGLWKGQGTRIRPRL
jgi:hypothetical protein